MTQGNGQPLTIRQRIEAPAPLVAAYMGDFRHARHWMVGVEDVELLGGNTYRLRLDTPIGKLAPEVTVHEHNPERVRWSYDSVVDGGGLVEISSDGTGVSVVTYSGEFRLRRRFLGRIARAAGMDRFVLSNGERSLERLKHLMEARRY
ncbi:MAG: SRPBCC family protein [Rubrobacteraceae bacterium]